MNMFRILTTTMALAACLASAPCQSAAQLTKELKAKEAAAQKDPDKMFEVAQWAKDKGLANDSKRLYQAILKLKPDHAGTNEAVGNELIEGKWLPAKEAEALRKKAAAAEFAAKGFVEVSGVWVEKDKVEDAKQGIFHHENELVNKAELLALQAGKVRHPDTGQLIDAKHLEKAKNKYYPVGNDRWVDLKEADVWHSDVNRPWIVRTTRGIVISTLGLDKLTQLGMQVDFAYDRVMPLLGLERLHPDKRPIVLIAATRSEYTAYGNDLGDGTDACGAFMAPKEAKIRIPYFDDVRMAVCDNDKDMGTRYVRHATGLALAAAAANQAGADLPQWLEHGIGSLTSRFHDESDAGWFGKAQQGRGGVGNVKAFFPSFAISGEMEPVAISHNLYGAGLLLSFAASGQDEKCSEAWTGVKGLFAGNKGNAEKTVAKLQTALIDAQPKIVTYLEQLVTKAPK
jgi:hypothetical protein